MEEISRKLHNASTLLFQGGGIYIADSTVTIDGSSIYSNAAYAGGGIYIAHGNVVDGIVNIDNSQISSNTADHYEFRQAVGGGIYITGSSTVVTISGSSIYENTANDVSAHFPRSIVPWPHGYLFWQHLPTYQ